MQEVFLERSATIFSGSRQAVVGFFNFRLLLFSLRHESIFNQRTYFHNGGVIMYRLPGGVPISGELVAAPANWHTQMAEDFKALTILRRSMELIVP
jgi:hypothetical protein